MSFLQPIFQQYTVNVDIFACINFLAFPKTDNFALINMRVFFCFCLPLCGTIKVIFTMYIFSRIFHKREYRENMYSAKNIYIHSRLSRIDMNIFTIQQYPCIVATPFLRTRGNQEAFFNSVRTLGGGGGGGGQASKLI